MAVLASALARSSLKVRSSSKSPVSSQNGRAWLATAVIMQSARICFRLVTRFGSFTSSFRRSSFRWSFRALFTGNIRARSPLCLTAYSTASKSRTLLMAVHASVPGVMLDSRSRFLVFCSLRSGPFIIRGDPSTHPIACSRATVLITPPKSNSAGSAFHSMPCERSLTRILCVAQN